MFSWLFFTIICFWTSLFSFLLAPINFFFLILLSEVVWITLFNLTSIVGSIIDDIGCFSISFFVLGFASIELCFGLLLLVFLKQLKLNIILNANLKKNNAKSLERLLAHTRIKSKF